MGTADRLQAGIVRVLSAQGSTVGTGFVAAAGLVVTCAHVVVDAGAQPGGRIRLVRHVDGTAWEGEVRAEWWGGPGQDDIAVLAVPDAPGEAALLPAEPGSPDGKTYSTYGFPDTRLDEGLPGRCDVRAATTRNKHPVYALDSNEVTFGFSGAPVWDPELGVVVGMVKDIMGVREVDLGRGEKGRFTVAADPGGRQTSTALMIPAASIRRRCPKLELPQGTPYRGLAAFEEPTYYFGRDAASRRLADLLRSEGLCVLVGPSGTGKSSLLRAGLRKVLNFDGAVDSRLRCEMTAVAGADPLATLVRTVAAQPVAAAALNLRPGTEGRDRLIERLRTLPPADAAHTLARAAPNGLLLLVDQFERVYSERHDDASVDHVTDILLALPDHGAAVAIALRADFYGHTLRHPRLAAALADSQLTVLGMTRDELREAITEPARQLGRHVQDALTDALLADVGGRPGALPLLQLTLEQLWKRDAHTGVLTLDGYRSLGANLPESVQAARGVAGAISREADKVWRKQLTDEERRVAPALFVRLVTAAGPDGGPGPEALTARPEWLAGWDDIGREVIAKFAARRLLVLRRDPGSGQASVEIAHEALLEAWPMLRRWVARHRAFGEWYVQDFSPAFRLWLAQDRQEHFLLPESLTAEAQRWCTEYPEGMTGTESYVQASVDRIERARQDAWQARRSSDESRSTLWATRATRSREPATALALAVAAGQLDHPAPFALQTLAELAYRRGLRDTLRFGHTAPVRAVAWQGDTFVGGSADRTVTVWDARTRQVVRTLSGHSGEVTGVALTADGQVAVSASTDRTVVRWDVASGRILTRFEGHQDAVLGVALSADGRRVVSASADNTAVVWDAHTGRALHHLCGHRDVVAGAAVSGDGRVAASCSSDRTVRVWDIASGGLLHILAGHDGPVWAVALNRDGTRAASGSADRTAMVWDVPAGVPLDSATVRHAATVWGVAFSGDDQFVVSGSSDRTVAVWDTAQRRVRARLDTGHTVNGLALDKTGELVLCAGEDHTLTGWQHSSARKVFALGAHRASARSLAVSADASQAVVSCVNGDLVHWDVRERHARLLGQDSPGVAVLLSRDGSTVILLTESGELTCWRTAAAARTGWPAPVPGPVRSAALSGDGRVCLIATRDGDAYLSAPQGWTRVPSSEAVTSVALDDTGNSLLLGLASGNVQQRTGAKGVPQELPGHEAPVRVLALSGDGSRALSADTQGRVLSWGLIPERGFVAELRVASGPVESVTLSREGRSAVLRTKDQVLCWDLATGEHAPLIGPAAGMPSPAFSADGQWVVTAGEHAELGLWDARRGDVLRTLHLDGRDPVRALAVSPDGQFAMSGTSSGSLTLWDLDRGQALDHRQADDVHGLALTAHASRALLASELLCLSSWEPFGTRHNILSGHTEAVRCVAVSPDGRLGVSGGADHRVLLWDTSNDEFLRALDQHTGTVHCVAVSADGRTAISGSADASLIVWDTGDGGVVGRFGHGSAVRAAALSPDAGAVATGTDDGTVTVWRPADGSSIVLVGHRCAVQAVAFSPDGRFVVSGDEEGTVLVWHALTGQQVRRFTAADGAVTGLGCAADDHGMVLVTGGADGRIRTWRLHTDAELTAWTYAYRELHRFSCAERAALHMEPPCDPLGNPPPESPPAAPAPLTRAALAAPRTRVASPQAPARTLVPGRQVFDAVQPGRFRTWALAARAGAELLLEVRAGGIDLDPRLTLLGPGGLPVATGRRVGSQRTRIGPVRIRETGEHTAVVEGEAPGPGGGYTILLSEGAAQ